MEFRIAHAPVFSTLEVTLGAGESVAAQPGSMLTMSAGVRISARVGREEHSPMSEDSSQPGKRSLLNHSWFSGFRSLLGGESFFTAEFIAKLDDQTVVLAPESYGDIVALPLQSTGGFYLTRGSYLANTGATNVHAIYGGLKGLMSKKGLFLMHATGTGIVFCQSYGSVIIKDLADGESMYVDNKFMVAFSDTVTYQLVKAADSVKDSLMSGEGLINRYTGPGQLFYQTRGKPAGGILSTIVQAAI